MKGQGGSPPIVGKWIGEANIEHHTKPRAFVTRSWWASSWDLALTGLIVVAGAWWLKALTWQVCHRERQRQPDPQMGAQRTA